MATRSPSRAYGLFELADDFRSGLVDFMSQGFSVHHLAYLLYPFPSDVLSGDPPQPGYGRFTLSWSPLPGFALSPDLNRILLERFPVRAITHPTETVTGDWGRLVKYVLFSIQAGMI